MRYWKPRPIKGAPLVGVQVATYLDDVLRCESLRTLVGSFLSQTYKHWRMRIVHDGPTVDPIAIQTIGNLQRIDPRVSVVETLERRKCHGHPWRQVALDQLMLEDKASWLMATNDDNYYAPVFLEHLLFEGQTADADVVFCNMIHSHQMWRPFDTAFQYKKIDMGAFLVRDRLAKHVPFDKFTFNGDGDWIDRLKAATKKPIVKVPSYYFVHN